MAKIQQETQQEIIGRIRHLLTQLNLTQAQFGQRIGVNPANMSKHLSGKLPITMGLINRISLDFGVSRQWLITGDDVPFAKEGAKVIEGEAIASGPAKGVPVYDIDVTAGYGALSKIFTTEQVSGHMFLPQLPSDDIRVVRVSGNSMEPTISNGGYIAVRERCSDTILWGQIYVVVFEDYRVVKVLRRHPDTKKIVLHSINPEFDDIEVNRADVQGIYLVEAIINYTKLV